MWSLELLLHLHSPIKVLLIMTSCGLFTFQLPFGSLTLVPYAVNHHVHDLQLRIVPFH